MSLNVELAGDDSDKKSRTLVFKEGGHTFGNALSCIISRYPDAVLCGYTIPHPSEATTALLNPDTTSS